MNMQENLQKIQDACAKANPDGLLDQTGESEWSFKREIRLADVLLVMPYWIGPSIKNGYACWLRFDEGDMAVTCAEQNSWNLLDDDLSHQSPECIEFISSLI